MLAVRTFTRAALAFGVTLALAGAAAAQDKMGDYIDMPVGAVQRALGDRAQFVDADLKPATSPDPAALVQWQTPLPGASFASDSKGTFVFSKRVRVPELRGMALKLAKSTLEAKGLFLQISDLSCASGCHVPSADELQGKVVDQQCAAAGSWIDVGAFVCVVVEPAGDSSGILLALALGVAGVTALVSIALWLRLRNARDEVRLARAGAAQRREQAK